MSRLGGDCGWAALKPIGRVLIAWLDYAIAVASPAFARQLSRMRFERDGASAKLAVAAVHLLTASGAALGLLALFAAARKEWSEAFLWLGAALVVDGIDGPLARRFDVEAVLPRFSGARLDLVVDYLNYCVVPAFMVATSDLIPPPFAPWAGALVAISSLFHFADRHSKTDDSYFVGFPAIWNVVALYLFAFGIKGVSALTIVAILAVLTFVPITWPHPMRVRTLRPATMTATVLWAVAAVSAVVDGFPAPYWAQVVLLATAVYFLWLAAYRSLTKGMGRG